MDRKQPEPQPQPKPKTPDALYWTGETGPDGNPLVWLDGIPARDLDAADIAGLSGDDLQRAVRSNLYTLTEPKRSAAKAAEAAGD
jgi:hypothetical protein